MIAKSCRGPSLAILVVGHKAQKHIKIDGLSQVGNGPVTEPGGEDILIGRGDEDGENGRIDAFKAGDEVQAVHSGQIEIDQREARVGAVKNGLKRLLGRLKRGGWNPQRASSAAIARREVRSSSTIRTGGLLAAGARGIAWETIMQLRRQTIYKRRAGLGPRVGTIKT